VREPMTLMAPMLNLPRYATHRTLTSRDIFHRIQERHETEDLRAERQITQWRHVLVQLQPRRRMRMTT
jgi:hypothetical protein